MKCPNCGAQKSPWGVYEGRKLICQFCWHEWIYNEAEDDLQCSASCQSPKVTGSET